MSDNNYVAWEKKNPNVYDHYPNPERVVAAAVWYDYESLTTNCLPHNIGRGIVLSGFAHQQVINAVASMKPTLHGRCGFLTSHNRFVDREEAMMIARHNEQIVRKNPYDSASLFSEDLFCKE